MTFPFTLIEEKETMKDCYTDYNLFTEALDASRDSFKDEPKVIIYKNRFTLRGFCRSIMGRTCNS